MSRQHQKPRKPRKTTAETVVRTHLAVITGPENDGQTISIRHELELVKASLLYADTVEVLSLGNQMVREVNSFAAGDATNVWALLAWFDDDVLSRIAPDLDTDLFRQILPVLMKPEAARNIAALDPTSEPLAKLAELLEQSNALAGSSMGELQQIANRIHHESGVAELETVLGKKLVRFNENVSTGGNADATVESFTRELKRYLQDPTRFVLLDAETASLARSLIDEGQVRLPERAMSNASQAALGTGLLARLPAFTTAPLDEIVDLRGDLDEPLSRYRRKVSQLRGHLLTAPFDQHIEAEIDAVWRDEVDPAITEIRQAMADHGLVREILRSFSANVADFVKGGWVPAGITLFSADMLDLNAALTTGLAGAAAAAPTVAGAVRSRQEGRVEARAHDLYYLYEVNQKLSS